MTVRKAEITKTGIKRVLREARSALHEATFALESEGELPNAVTSQAFVNSVSKAKSMVSKLSKIIDVME